MIIDFHTHTFPERIAARAIAGIQANCHSAAFADGTDAALRRSMAEAGIHRAVVLPVATNPTKLASMNGPVLEKREEDGLIRFGAMHPAAEDWKEQLEALARAGEPGIKLHPVYQGVDITDSRYLRILDRCGQLGLIVVMHAGDEIAYPGQVRCSPEMIARALSQVGPVKTVLAHMGGWKNWDRVVEHIGPTGAFVDTSLSLGKIQPLEPGQEERLLLRREAFCELVRCLGSHRVLFGTDSPWADQKAERETIGALDLTEKQKREILLENAAEILGLPV